ncbi:MAG: ABC-type transport system involved in multi-copper enzyme maturation permease subunit [Pseudohongiellaceae bacterium]|jgi:ABC-type transport system involved in multi-copper enzyme maturation permease subunit
MKGLKTALLSELFIGLRSFSSKLIVFGPALIAACQLLIVKLSELGAQSRDTLLGSGQANAAITGNAYGYFVDGLLLGLMILGLLIVGLAAYSISIDRDTGQLRHLVIRRISRPAIVLGKLLYLHLLASLAIGALVLASYGVSASLWEFGPIVEDGFVLISESEIHQEISLGLRLALLPVPAAIAFGVLVSVITQTPTQAISTALGITLAIDVFKSSLGDVAYYFYASFQASLLDQSYLNDVSRLVRGFSDVLVDNRFLEMNTWVPLPTALIFTVAAVLIIRKIKI